MMEREHTKRTRIVGIRLTSEEFRQIEKKWKISTSKKLSDYLRNVFLGRPIVKTYRNRSLDDLIAELALLRRELNRIGINFNQSVKKLHTLRDAPEFRRWLLTHEVEKRTMVNKMNDIKKHIQKIVDLWLR